MEHKPNDKGTERNTRRDRKTVKSVSIPVIEETLDVGKQKVESGKVKVSKKIFEEEETIDVPTLHEKLSVERVAVNKYVDSPPPAIRHEGDTTIIPVLEEVVVVEKRLLLVEEVHIRKHQTEERTRQKVTLRKEEVRVDRKKGGPSDEEGV